MCTSPAYLRARPENLQDSAREVGKWAGAHSSDSDDVPIVRAVQDFSSRGSQGYDRYLAGKQMAGRAEHVVSLSKRSYE